MSTQVHEEEPRPTASATQPRPAWLTHGAGRYLATGAVPPLLAHALQAAVWPYIPPSPHLLFYPAVFVAARVGGAGPGYIATAISAICIAFEFLPPLRSISVDLPKDILNLFMFVGVACGISHAMGRLREALATERAEKDAARTAKAATDATWSMVAHDLKTPLSTISLGSDALIRKLANQTADLQRTAQAIQRASSGASDLVRDALDAMRSAEGALRVDPAPCDIGEVVAHAKDAVALLAATSGVRVDSDVSTRRVAMCDEPRIIQVLANLLVNAVRFTPPRGRVSVYAEDDAGGIRLSVVDTGVGIPAEELDAIFSRYWSGGGGGSGLGLWIAKSIVEAHGGAITVESRVGEGTKFSFLVPAASDEAPTER